MGRPNSVACMLLLFLILIPVSQEGTCRPGTDDECRRASFVPSYYLVGGGFDITTMEPRRSRIVDMDQWNRSDRACTLCQNSILDGHPWQKIPADANEWSPYTVCKQTVTSQMHHSLMSIADMQLSKMIERRPGDTTIPLPKYGGTVSSAVVASHSHTVLNLRKVSLHRRNHYFQRETTCTFYRLGIRSEPTLTDSFKYELDRIPEHYNDNTKFYYFRLIRNYGTHVVTLAYLGGIDRITTSVETCGITLNHLDDAQITNCLGIMFAGAIGANHVSADGSYDYCQNQQSINQFSAKLSKIHRYTNDYIRGGDTTLMAQAWKNGVEKVEKWLKTVKVLPSILKCELDPIYTIVAEGNPRRVGLQKALTEYLEKRYLEIDCTNVCQSGPADSTQECSCECSDHGLTDKLCCPKQRRTGFLTVWIDSASDLYGDIFGASDASVHVTFGSFKAETDIIWNNNYPQFNKRYDVGIIQIIEGASILRIVVKEWDHWGTSILGSCNVALGADRLQSKVCSLNHGVLRYRYEVKCPNNLQGDSCQNYFTEKPTYQNILAS